MRPSFHLPLHRLALIVLMLAMLMPAALAGGAARTHGAAAAAARDAATVAERYISEPIDGEELDSLSTWTTPEGASWLIASGKSSHRLTVFDADTGRRLRHVGGPGTAPGQFDRPNGLAVHTVAGTGQALLFVVERDNHRVQVLRLPDFKPLTVFGSDVLRSPYGIWLHPSAPDVVQAYVTDSFMYGQRHDVVPPLAELAQRVRRFRIDMSGAQPRVTSVRSFGDTTQAGALRMVESLAGDPPYDRLLVADEATAPGYHSNLREYTLDGRSTGRSLPEGSFAAEAEGVALWACGDHRYADGYWIAVDQLTPLTRFHVFDRKTLQLRGTWQGKATADTDGIALRATPTRAFPDGALFAVNRDRAVAAFDLADVASALKLEACAG